MNLPIDNHQLTARDVYCRVIEETEPSQRQRQLDLLCSGRPDLRSQVERLLEAREQADQGLLARLVGGLETDADGAQNTGALSSIVRNSSGSELTGQQLGPYRLLETLGEGGMGTVYRAKQLAPLEREVALKVIKPELNTGEAIARFAQERQAMALMEHPNIASVFDGGEAADGSHYLVMELIRGKPLDTYCYDHNLSVEQRLRLFADVGRAISHAHSKNIIHRDLKPRNILVATVSDQPMVKVIDFGIAKSFGLPTGFDHEQTRIGQVLGTPLYQSPEQLDARHAAVDVRSDVYALGVLLYKLLTDTTPIDREVLAQVGYEGLMRKLLQQDYDSPSLRARKMADSSMTAPKGVLLGLPNSRQRQLDWITLKALHPDPESRYHSVADMLNDLNHYVNREPISAGPPQPLFRLRKWMHQHRASVLVATALTAIFALSAYVVSRRTGSPNEIVSTQPQTEVDSATIWRETAQLQAAIGAFREADYSALRTLIEGIPQSSRPRKDSMERSAAAGTGHRIDLPGLLYRAAHPTPRFVLPDSADIQSADYSPQSGRLLVATKEGELRLYTCQDGLPSQPPVVIGNHPGRVDALAISPDGSKAVTGTDALRFWNLDDATLSLEGVWLDAGIESVVWSPDGQTVAAGARYQCTWVGDSNGRELFRVPNNHRHETILFTPDSKSLLVPTRQGVDEYQLSSGRQLRTIDVRPLENVRTMTLAGHDRRHLIVADRFDETALVIDVATGQTVGALPLFGSYPHRFRPTGDGQWLASLYSDGKCSLLRLREDESGRVEAGPEFAFQIYDSQRLADEDRLEFLWLDAMQQCITLGGRHPAQVWDWSDFDPVQIKGPPMQLWDVLAGRADDLIFFPNDSREIGHRAYFIPLAGKSYRPIGDRLNEPLGIFSRSSDNQLVASLGENAVEILDLATGDVLTQIPCGELDGNRRISLSRGGTAVAVGNDDRVRLWTTEDRWKTWAGNELPLLDPDVLVHLTDSGESLCVNVGRVVHEVDILTGTTIRTYDDEHAGSPWQLEINEQAGRVIIGKRDTLTILNRQSGELLNRFDIDSEVTSILSTEDDSLLLTGHRDGTIRVWHLTTMQALGVLFQPKQRLGTINRLEVFPGRNRILAVARRANQLSPIILGN